MSQAAPRTELERPLDIVQQSATFAAEISGIDLSQPLDQPTFEALRDALMEHKVLCFRDQEMTPAQHVALGKRFGEITVHPLVPHLPDRPEVIVLDNHKDNPVFSTDCWHSDETFRVEPPMGSILRCMEIPDAGGDTLWADMCAIYEGLSDKMRSFVSDLEAIHDFRNFRHKFDDLSPKERHDRLAEMEEQLPNPTHPVVRTHPVTGAKAIFVNEQFTVGIKGMKEGESRALLTFLWHQVRIPEYQFRFHWRRNSVVFWDNRPTQHYAANDYYPKRRTMQRVTIKGDRPF